VAAGSGIGNVYQNSKWLLKGSGRVQLPYSVNFAISYLGRQGFPFPATILTPNRANSAGTAQVLLDPMGDVRYDTLNTFDMRLDRTFHFGQLTVIPAMDLFNLANTNTVQAKNIQQAASNANVVSGIIAPRVARFGVSVRW
jgi:hypothetical protein